jgi:hypothetical protein
LYQVLKSASISGGTSIRPSWSAGAIGLSATVGVTALGWISV